MWPYAVNSFVFSPPPFKQATFCLHQNQYFSFKLLRKKKEILTQGTSWTLQHNCTEDVLHGGTAMACVTLREPPGCSFQPILPSKRGCSLELPFINLGSHHLLLCAMWKAFLGRKQLPAETAAALQEVQGHEMGWCPPHLGRAQRQVVISDQLVWGILAPSETMTPRQDLFIIKKYLRSVQRRKEGRTQPPALRAFRETRTASQSS